MMPGCLQGEKPFRRIYLFRFAELLRAAITREALITCGRAKSKFLL